MTNSGSVHTDHLPGRTLIVDGVEHLYCSGTSYLGISRNRRFLEHLLDGMQRYGTNYSSSRNNNLQLQVYEEAEAYLATYAGAEAALTMSSGYLAGQALVQLLQGSGHFILAPGTHPAVWPSIADAPAADLPYEVWVSQLLQRLPELPHQQVVIVCNSLDPLKGRNYSFEWLQHLPAGKKMTLVVDDSHGFGVTGENGSGIYRQLAKYSAQVRVVVVSSFGKAFGIPAGVILGGKELVQQLRASAFFGGASPAVPAYLYAFLQAGQVFEEARQQLYSNISFFRKQLHRPEMFSFFDNYPVFSTANQALCPYLLQHRILISSFRYPSPADAPTTRVILNSLHTADDLQRLATHVNELNAVPDQL